MVDLILLGTVVAAYAGGFWCGKKYGSVRKMIDELKSHI